MSEDKSQKQSDPPFLFAEECGLALMKHQQTGKKFYLDIDVWAGLEQSVKAGWKPKHSRSLDK